MSDMPQPKIEYTGSHHIEVPKSCGIPFDMIILTPWARTCIVREMVAAGWDEQHFSVLDIHGLENVVNFYKSKYMQKSDWFRKQRVHRLYYLALQDNSEGYKLLCQPQVLACFTRKDKIVHLTSYLENELPENYEVDRLLEETRVDMNIRA